MFLPFFIQYVFHDCMNESSDKINTAGDVCGSRSVPLGY